MNICVVGRQDTELAQHVARSLQVPFYPFTHDYFADTESILRITDARFIADRVVLLVYQFIPSSPEAGGDRYTCINHQFLDLLFLVGQLKLYRAERIVLVVPYIPYSRQEKKTEDGMASPFERALMLLRNSGVDDIIACDLHAVGKFNQSLHQVLLTDLWTTFLQSHLSMYKHNPESLCIASPDQGGVARANAVARHLGAGIAFVRKERPEKDFVIMHDVIGDVQGKVVVLLDDILDTGRTAIQACQMMREQGAVRVIGCFSHGVLSSGSLARLRESCFDEIFLTDTLIFDQKSLPSHVHVVSIVSYLVQHIDRFVQHIMYKEPSCKPRLICHQ